MRVVLSGGGTGGHIYPALALAKELRRQLGDAVDIDYVGSATGLERDLVPRAGLPFHPIAAGGLLKPGVGAKVAGAWRTLNGLGQAMTLLRRLRPTVVVGTGGYVAGPVGLAAAWLRIPLVIQEQNVWPGLTNRWLARRAAVVLAPYADAVRYFPSGTRVRVVGNPVRTELLERGREDARAELGIAPEWVLVVAFGGSQGAPAINRVMEGVWQAAMTDAGLAILWATGPRHYAAVRRRLDAMGPAPSPRLRAVDYLYGMETALAAADLVVGRAGAMTCAEVAARGVAAVLVPSPYVSEHHQERNAQFLADRGAALVVSESDAPTKGVEAVMALRRDGARRAAMAAAAARLHHPDALTRMAATVLEVAGYGRKNPGTPGGDLA
jgi:UDP-N-acetylglucosamine--N-acetylmuramyl-(pentapeptide) pyrophosphoryl-undecaprenol N-acetylglucosamine transferase